MTSIIEKIIAAAPSFLGANITVQWKSAYGYMESAVIDGFDIGWGDWGDKEPCIRFWTTDFRRELYFLRSGKVEQLEVGDDQREFIFPISGITSVQFSGETTYMRMLKIKDEPDLSGPIRVSVSKA